MTLAGFLGKTFQTTHSKLLAFGNEHALLRFKLLVMIYVVSKL